MEYKIGSIIQFSWGSYSDYEVGQSLVVIVETLDLKEQAQKYSNEIYHTKGWLTFDKFGAFLVKNQLCMPVDEALIHLGDYSEFNSEFKVKTHD